MDTEVGIHEWDREQQRLASVFPAYEIGAVLGRGSFAVVYAARHRNLHRDVAIKRLSPELLRSSDSRDRFAAEARLLASLDHPHIVRVYDYVEEEDLCAFVMERLPAGTLGMRLTAGRPSRPWACAVTLGALYGLEHAHHQGVLHRDVKPDNLLFTQGDLVKVADFGIAKVLGAQGARMTATAAGIGTPAYMAPEQVTRQAGPLSPATDVWAVGAVLYEMLAGRPPFGTTGDLGEVLIQRVTEDPPPLRETAREVPARLGEVVMRSLARDPAERFATPAEFAAALEPVAGDLETTGVPIHRTTAAPGGAVQRWATKPTLRSRLSRRSRRTLVAVVAAAVLAVLALGAGVVVLTGGGPGDNSGRGLPRAPTGWPATLTTGFIDQVDGIRGAARRVGKGGTSFALYGGDPATGTDWSRDRGQPSPAAFVRDTARAGLMPYVVFHVLRVVGQKGQGDDADAIGLRRTLSDRRLMDTYWRNVRAFLRILGATGQRVAVSLDSNFWSYLEQDLDTLGRRPATVRAQVGRSGLPELRGLSDTLIGIAAGWRTLRDRYAPKVMLGYAFDDWAGGVDISRDSPARQTVIDSAGQAAQFFNTVAAGDMDFAALTVNGEAEEGQNPSEAYVYSPAEKDALVTFVREFARVADVPVVLEGVPLGNTVTKAITDKPFHWRDSWVEWLVGDDRFTGLRRLHDAGVIGVMFGVSWGEGETCPCDAAGDGVTDKGKYPKPSTSADDDGGYFADRIAALRRSGGLAVK